MKIQKDKNKRNLNLESEQERVILKSIVKNSRLLKAVKWNSKLRLTTLVPNSHKTRLTSRCILTGRKAKFHKLFKISRLAFLRIASNGIINGLSK